MLQNISRSYEEDKQENNINVKEVLSRIFSAQNIIIYILTFMISMVGFGAGNDNVIAPFGLALVASSISCGLPIAMVYLSSILRNCN